MNEIHKFYQSHNQLHVENQLLNALLFLPQQQV